VLLADCGLLEELTGIDCSPRQSAGPDAVSVLGSFHTDAMRMEAELRIRAWQAGQRSRGVHVDVELELYH
jgi:hypothetical protein